MYHTWQLFLFWRKSHEATNRNRIFLYSVSQKISGRTYNKRSAMHTRNIRQDCFQHTTFRSDQKHQSGKKLSYPQNLSASISGVNSG